MDTQREKKRLLDEWALLITENAHKGALTGPRQEPIQIFQTVAINGPRAGALLLHAGLESGKLLRIFNRDDQAIAAQFVPWDFEQLACFRFSRYIRLEANWPDHLAEKDIQLKDMGRHPTGGGRWLAGRNEWGQTVTLGLNDETPSFLVAGTTGSGKSYAMRLAVSQLSQDPENKLVLLDGKWGDGLGIVAHVANRIGPLATEPKDIKNALGWCISELQGRYSSPQNGDGRLIIFFDEFQEVTTKDSACADMLRRLTSQGRAQRVYCVVGTHHPIQEMFGTSVTKNTIPGRLALRVLSVEASRAAVGDKRPYAHHLLGRGDAYCISTKACHRAQLAYVSEHDLSRLPNTESQIEEWPDFDPEAAGTEPEDTVNWAYTGEELGASLWQAHLGHGRRKLTEAMQEEGFDIREGSRVTRLAALGKEAYAWLQETKGLTLCQNGSGRVGGLAIEDTPSDAWEAFFERVSVG
jgi:hypothetical protein